MQIKTNSTKPFCLRASVSAYIVFCFLVFLPFLMSLWSLYREMSSWPLAVLCLLCIAFIFLWLASYKLELSDDRISYRTLFRGTMSLLLYEIDKVEVKLGITTYSDRFRPTIRMIFKPKSNIEKPEIVVNLKIFSKGDLALLQDFINTKIEHQFAHKSDSS